jgi:hypothetical protein
MVYFCVSSSCYKQLVSCSIRCRKCYYYFQLLNIPFQNWALCTSIWIWLLFSGFDLVYVIESGVVRFIRLQVARDDAELLMKLRWDSGCHQWGVHCTAAGTGQALSPRLLEAKDLWIVYLFNVLAYDFGALLLQNGTYCWMLEGYWDP